MQPDNFHWDELLIYVKDRRVVPVIGPGLLSIETDGKGTLVEDYLAERLATELKVGNTSERPTVSEVAFNYIQSGGKRQRVYALVHRLLEDKPIVIPQSLRQLAAITDLNLFVSITFDDLLLRAVTETRGAYVESLAYSPDRPLEDLTPSMEQAMSVPTVYRLFGRVSSVPGDYAVTEEDTLEFLHSLQSEHRQPKNLFGALRDNYVLLIGCRLHDWLARFFVRTVRNERLLKAAGTGELVVDKFAGNDERLVHFLTQYATDVYSAADPSRFVDELYRRWRETLPAQDDAGQQTNLTSSSSGSRTPSGVIFLSYAKEDRESVRLLKDALEAAGLEAWMDERDIAPGADWDLRIKDGIRRCAVFVPCLSQHAEARLEGYFRREWQWAIDRSLALAHTVRFVWPVVLDNLRNDASNIRPEFLRWQWSYLQDGKPGPELISELTREIRQIRSTKHQQAPS